MEPDTNGRLKEIISIIRKYDYSDGITPEIVVKILQDLGPTFVKIGQIASQQAEYIPDEYCDERVKLRSKVAPMEIEKVLDTFIKGDLGGIDVKSMITELEQTSKRELDFTNEAKQSLPRTLPLVRRSASRKKHWVPSAVLSIMRSAGLWSSRSLSVPACC